MGDGELGRELKDRYEVQEIVQTGLSGDTLLGSKNLLEYRVTWAYADEDEPDCPMSTSSTASIRTPICGLPSPGLWHGHASSTWPPYRVFEGTSDRPIQEEVYSWWGTLSLKFDL